MESEKPQEPHQLMQHEFSQLEPIDPGKARFPCCIVWTPLPLLSWFIPFIGHIGICREDGVILDFAAPNFVCVDNFAFGRARRYIQIDREKCNISPFSSLEAAPSDDYDHTLIGKELHMTWDEALKRGIQEFQHRGYNLLTCNCHSFVANNLNRMLYSGHNKWNVVNLATFIFLKASWVSTSAVIRTFLPCLIVLGLGLIFGGSTFLFSLVAFYIILVGWFVIGTYCFKDLIQL